MKLQLFAIILMSVALSAVAQLCLKVGVGRAAPNPRSGTFPGIFEALFVMLTSPYVLIGLALYGIGAVVWLFVLRAAPLSLAYPFVGMGFIATAAIGVFGLGEQMTMGRALGTILIAIGCIIVARSA